MCTIQLDVCDNLLDNTAEMETKLLMVCRSIGVFLVILFLKINQSLVCLPIRTSFVDIFFVSELFLSRSLMVHDIL